MIGARCIGTGAAVGGVKAPRVPIRGTELRCPPLCAVALDAAKTDAIKKPRTTIFVRFIALCFPKLKPPRCESPVSGTIKNNDRVTTAIRLLSLQRFCLTRPAHKTQRAKQPRLSLTTRLGTQIVTLPDTTRRQKRWLCCE